MNTVGHMNNGRNAGHHAEMNKGEYRTHVVDSYPITYAHTAFALVWYFLIYKPVLRPIIRRNK